MFVPNIFSNFRILYKLNCLVLKEPSMSSDILPPIETPKSILKTAKSNTTNSDQSLTTENEPVEVSLWITDNLNWLKNLCERIWLAPAKIYRTSNRRILVIINSSYFEINFWLGGPKKGRLNFKYADGV